MGEPLDRDIRLTTYGPHNAPNKFYTARGRLTRYALACGYVERRTSNIPERETVTELYMEHRCFHIRSTGPTVPDQFPNNPNNSHRHRQWDTARTLTEARKLYAKHIREYHKC